MQAFRACYSEDRGVARGWPGWLAQANPNPVQEKNYKAKTHYSIYDIHTAH